MEEERAQRGAGNRRGAQPGRARAVGARHQREQPRPAGARRRGGRAQRADRRLGAAERHYGTAHDADAAHGEERQYHARRGSAGPGGRVPARQGHQHLPPYASGPGAELRGKLGELESAFKEYQRAVSAILGNQQSLVNAKRASFELFNDSETLLGAAERLAAAYDAEQERRQWNFAALGAVSLLALLVLLLIGKVYVDDSRLRAEGSERSNRANQDAILRLLDEIGNLANGDLTVRAKVTEDVTGAIADSINYTIDELRRLVAGINGAAQQVTSATQEAQAVTGQLLQAAQKQATEIQGTGQSVAQMTLSMHEVSKSANDSAAVAKTSLSAAA